MNTPSQLEILVAEIERDFPSARVDWDPFPSGDCVLFVELKGRDFELDYSPGSAIGVSEYIEDSPPVIGHDESFDSLEQAIQRLKELLASAARGESSPPTPAMARHDEYPLNKKP